MNITSGSWRVENLTIKKKTRLQWVHYNWTWTLNSLSSRLPFSPWPPFLFSLILLEDVAPAVSCFSLRQLFATFPSRVKSTSPLWISFLRHESFSALPPALECRARMLRRSRDSAPGDSSRTTLRILKSGSSWALYLDFFFGFLYSGSGATVRPSRLCTGRRDFLGDESAKQVKNTRLSGEPGRRGTNKSFTSSHTVAMRAGLHFKLCLA